MINARLAGIDASRILRVFNKADAGAPRALPADAIKLSAKTGDGLAALRQRLLQQVGWHATPQGQFIARERHVQALKRTCKHLALAHQLVTQTVPALDLLAEELRLAHDALGESTGSFSADDLLGAISSSFCIGK